MDIEYSKNKKKGRILEEAYEWLWDFIEKKNCIVESPKYCIDNVTGQLREIDVSIERFSENGELIEKIMVECRNRENVEDVTWVEQVATKKIDLGFDKAIMVTTSSFTKPARIKAKNKGIELERSSSLKPEFIEKQKLELKGAANFVFIECTSIIINTEKGQCNNIYLDQFSDIKNYIKAHLNNYCESGLVDDLKHAFDIYPNFFKVTDNPIIINKTIHPRSSALTFINIKNESYKKFGKINTIKFVIKIKPRIESFPISRIITIFDDDEIREKSNKRHKSQYENDKIKIIFQIQKDEMYFDILLKEIPAYCKFIGFDCRIYALLHNVNPDKMKIHLHNHPKDIMGEIYFGNIWKDNAY